MLEIKKLCCGYAGHLVLKDISFSLKKGSVLCVLGANGSGKSTLFKALLKFLHSEGEMLWQGEDFKKLSLVEFAKLMSYIPQAHNPAFSYTVEEIAMMGRAAHIPAFGSPGKSDGIVVLEMLEKLNILHLKDRRYTEISGGERRLALIARALCQQAELMVMDEPSSELDYANQRLVQNTIANLKAEGHSIILSTHAPEYPFALADEVLLLGGGRAVAYGKPAEALNSSTLEQAYGVKMEVVEVLDSLGNLRRLCLPI